MATYEYVCLACEHRFEERRPMGASSVDTELACPSCGGDRVRRRFSFVAGLGPDERGSPHAGGCACGGACGCG